ncbi:hypothetical protein C8R46DRAFT_1040544 [Mycena filopes]|nr:hypothetical protein C8R46DRAFT_1040544 [Mycena filopes]
MSGSIPQKMSVDFLPRDDLFESENIIRAEETMQIGTVEELEGARRCRVNLPVRPRHCRAVRAGARRPASLLPYPEMSQPGLLAANEFDGMLVMRSLPNFKGPLIVWPVRRSLPVQALASATNHSVSRAINEDAA